MYRSKISNNKILTFLVFSLISCSKINKFANTASNKPLVETVKKDDNVINIESDKVDNDIQTRCHNYINVYNYFDYDIDKISIELEKISREELDQILSNILKPPIILYIINSNFSEIRKAYTGKLYFLSYNQEIEYIKRREKINNFSTYNYLLALCTTLSWIDKYKNNPNILNQVLKLSDNVKNIISDNKYIKAFNYFYENKNNLEGREAARQIIEYRKNLKDRYHKFLLEFSLGELNQMAVESNESGIAYREKLCKKELYLCPELIDCNFSII